MKGIRFFILVLVIFSSGGLKAQQELYVEDSANVVVHTDPRLAIVLATIKPRVYAPGTGPKTGTIRSGRGFRVQIYNGNDRNKATALKVDFIRKYPKMGAYMTYIQPQFRVKVGDFRSRGEAQKFLDQISSLYSPVMIVPDIIVINTFKDDQ